MTHPGYFGDARHDRTIGVRPLPRSVPGNAVRKLLVGDGEQPKNVCVMSGRRSRETRRQEHAPSRICWVTRLKKIRGSPRRNLWREPRKPAARDAASNVSGRENAKQRGPRTAPKGAKLPAQLRLAAACRPACTAYGPPTRAAPPQRHGRRRMTAARPAAATQERRLAPDATLRRQLSRAPHPSPTPPCARGPPSRHAQPSAEPVCGAQLPSPTPSGRGAAAPSSPPYRRQADLHPNLPLTAPHSFGDLVWESHTIDWESPKRAQYARFGGQIGSSTVP